MDGFVYSEGNDGTMSYYDRTDLARYWKAAQQYVLCDRYFTSVMSESAPNHLFLVAGTAAGAISTGLRRFNRFLPAIEVLSGALLIAVGVLLIANRLTMFNGYFDFFGFGTKGL